MLSVPPAAVRHKRSTTSEIMTQTSPIEQASNRPTKLELMMNPKLRELVNDAGEYSDTPTLYRPLAPPSHKVPVPTLPPPISHLSSPTSHLPPPIPPRPVVQSGDGAASVVLEGRVERDATSPRRFLPTNIKGHLVFGQSQARAGQGRVTL